MDLVRFYRLPTWYKNMGIAIIGVLSSGHFSPLLAAVGLLQVFLIQTHSFSMNDYYDHVFWGEETYIGELLEKGWSRGQILFLGNLPLLMALMMYPVSGNLTIILVAYSVLFYLYQGRPRLKEHYATSLILNSVCLGLIVYAYPYLIVSRTVTTVFIFFSILFTFYMMFYEAAHQVEHQRDEDIHSLVDMVDTKNAVRLGLIFQAVPGLAGIFLILHGLNPAFVAGTAFFAVLRGYTLYGEEENTERIDNIRGSWHKLFMAHEGFYYLLLLTYLMVY